MKIIVYLVLFLAAMFANAQDKVIKLYNGTVPNSKFSSDYKENSGTAKDSIVCVKNGTDPELLVFYPKKTEQMVRLSY
jgi:hypothetical protein